MTVFEYDLKQSWKTLLFGRDEYLDNIVSTYNIDSVLTIFGPSGWVPKCSHLVGFARAQLLMPDSPYYKRLKLSTLVKEKLYNNILAYFFTRNKPLIYTENPEISEMFRLKYNYKNIFTVTNYYNQIFDNKENWKEKKLPSFSGYTLLHISGVCAHKNQVIAIDIAKILKNKYPKLKFRFVFTFEEKDFVLIPDEIKNYFTFIGKVNIEECPSLYEQADIMFQPTLMECFTATYPEAMRMKCPIVTTDLKFAHGLCGDAAYYYSPLSAEAAANAIYKVSTDNELRNKLIIAGINHLKKYDDYNQRTQKLIQILETNL